MTSGSPGSALELHLCDVGLTALDRELEEHDSGDLGPTGRRAHRGLFPGPGFLLRALRRFSVGQVLSPWPLGVPPSQQHGLRRETRARPPCPCMVVTLPPPRPLTWPPPLSAGPRSLGGSAPVSIPGCLPRSPSLHSSSSLSTSPLSSLSQSLSGPLVSSAMTPPQQPPALRSEPGALGSSAASYSSLGEWVLVGTCLPCMMSVGGGGRWGVLPSHVVALPDLRGGHRLRGPLSSPLRVPQGVNTGWPQLSPVRGGGPQAPGPVMSLETRRQVHRPAQQ